MRDFVELLKRLKGKRVRIHFYIPAEASTATKDSVLSHLARIIDVEGTILKLDNRGEPAEREVGALETYLNLEAVVIWAVELIHEDYQPKEDEDDS